jgi:hypothetical protein
MVGGDLLGAVLRHQDMAGRVGRRGFGVLLPETAMNGAEEVASRSSDVPNARRDRGFRFDSILVEHRRRRRDQW